MKKVLITAVIFILLSIPISNYAQINNSGIKARNYSYESNLRHQQLVRDIENILIENRYYSMDEISGIPYNNKDFSIGEVFLGNESIGKYLLRYDIYNEELQTKQDENKITAFTRARSLNAQIGNDLLVFRDYHLDNEKKEGYFHVLSSGKNGNLLLKKLKIFKEGIKAQSSYQKDVSPKFIDKKIYFLEKGDNNLIELKKVSNKEILKILDNNTNIISFIKKNKINVKKQLDLTKLLDFYNTLEL